MLFDEMGTAWIKMGSGELTDLPFPLALPTKERPLLLSTGIVRIDEIFNAVGTVVLEHLARTSERPSLAAYPAALKPPQA